MNDGGLTRTTRNAIRLQLEAMGRGSFEIGVLRPNGRMLLREHWSQTDVLEALAWRPRDNHCVAALSEQAQLLPGADREYKSER